MRRLYSFLLFCFAISSGLGFSRNASGEISSYNSGKLDTIDKQILYNGRAWRNFYTKVIGDQFLFTSDFLPGTVSIANKTFHNILLKYDIFNDEIIAPSDLEIVIQLNKEMIDSFSLEYSGRKYYFKKMEANTSNTPAGYVNILAEGPVTLYVKYRKTILLLAVDNKYDIFNSSHRIYLKKDQTIYPVRNKKDLIRILNDEESRIRSFIRKNNSRIARRIPDSFKPIVEFYNGLQKRQLK